jgi:hypothetical protein
MARMLGLGGTKWCLASDLGRSRKRLVRIERSAEARELARSLRPEGLLPSLLDDPTDCVHGCNGDCLEAGSEVCTFTCH